MGRPAASSSNQAVRGMEFGLTGEYGDRAEVQ